MIIFAPSSYYAIHRMFYTYLSKITSAILFNMLHKISH